MVEVNFCFYLLVATSDGDRFDDRICFCRESLVPKFHPDCSMHQSNNQLKIEGLHNNAIIYPEANTQNMPDVELKLEGSSGSVYWFINGIQQENQLKTLTLSSLSLGHYTVTAVDDSANYTELEFDVAF